jgi:RecJ-like exonuclease
MLKNWQKLNRWSKSWPDDQKKWQKVDPKSENFIIKKLSSKNDQKMSKNGGSKSVKNVSKFDVKKLCQKNVKNVSKMCQKCVNFGVCKSVKNVSKCQNCKMSQNVTKCHKCAQNVTKCHEGGFSLISMSFRVSKMCQKCQKCAILQKVSKNWYYKNAKTGKFPGSTSVTLYIYRIVVYTQCNTPLHM